ncbi:egalitarian protein homolog [Procambarus clarkii]|uniref:egalitarian protein homolog n=1 Tax=Procambarus clarkii TaxID=6728 RepID=UPI001E67319C|nr:egalitarian protein homolog [Procambarus clarkii]
MNMDTKDYDHVRNLTLLFFLDRLMDKGQPRTLHDLSCQFGTKGFTKEMRQIAGGSQSGLRKFLQQYPSLFTLEDDYVSVTNYSNGISNPHDPTGKLLGKRDYAQEAVDYFVGKLRQYGAGTEVPIKSLLGHRSQASPEVRHVSGQHVKEFRDFLVRYPEVFVVREETVILKEYEGVAPQPFKELEVPQIDPILTQQVLQYCSAALIRGPLITETLFNGITNAFPKETLSQICRCSNDLATFLKMHSNTFMVQANMVRLVHPASSGPNNVHSHIYQSHTPQPPPQPQQPPPQPQQPPPQPQQPPPQYQQPQPQPQQQQYIQVQQQPQPPPQQPVQRGTLSPDREENLPVSPTSPGSPVRPHHAHSQQQQQQQQTLKARVNSLLRKTLADNSERDRVSYTGGGDVGSEGVTGRLLRHTRVVVSIREARQLVSAILAARQPVSFDGEGVNLGPSGPMTLLQIGLVSGHIYIFDVMVERSLMYEGGLRELLESTDIVKVAHDCRGDAGALYHQFGVTLNNVFDTQAAHAVLQQQETGKPVYKVKNVSLNTLCRSYNAPVNPRKDQMKNVYRRDQRFWARRPLTEDMIVYAAYDVVALVPTVYDAMKRQLDPGLLPLFEELCREQVEALIQPEEVKQKKKQRKIETEVAELKNKLATTQARAIVLSNREIRLLRYLELSDEEREKLEGSYKVAKKLERLQSKKERDESPDKNGEDEDENSDDDDDDERDGVEEGEYPSLSSIGSGGSGGSGGVLSPRCDGDGDGDSYGGSPSLTTSMNMVEQVLSNGAMDRFEKIDRLEAILAAATQVSGASSPVAINANSPPASCCCHCHGYSQGLIISPQTSPPHSLNNVTSMSTFTSKADAQCQTLSTGDIVITKVFFPDSPDNAKDKK